MKRLNLVLLIGFMGIGMSTVACGGDSEPSRRVSHSGRHPSRGSAAGGGAG